MQIPDESGSSAAVNNAPELDAFSIPIPPQQQQTDPDNPPWGVPMAILVWLASLVLLAIASALTLIPYAAYRGISPKSPDYALELLQFATKDPWAIFVQVASTLPAHIFTVLIAWAVVTRFGRLPFWKTLGWSWGRYFGVWTSLGAGVVLFVVSSAIAHFLGGDKLTPLEELINSSAATRYMIAVLATLTAPFVEELVFRGVLYSALQRLLAKIAAWVFGVNPQNGLPQRDQLIGKAGSVILVTVLFAAVHVPQYLTNFGVIAAICLLSLSLTVIRAVSGRLLPCFIVHLVFNGIQSVIILWSGGPPPVATPSQTGALFLSLLNSLPLLN